MKKTNLNTLKITFASCIIVILSITAVSCKKDVNGCTDSTADNYKIEANKDDGNCEFHGFLSPWYNNVTRDSLIANNIVSVSLFVDNETFTNINPNVILWSSEPECSTSTIGNWITMQGTKNRSISILVKGYDNSNTVVRQWVSSLNIQSGMCERYQIIW